MKIFTANVIAENAFAKYVGKHNRLMHKALETVVSNRNLVDGVVIINNLIISVQFLLRKN
jgi:RecA/RadA recombinase